MPDITIKQLDEMEPTFGGALLKARATLGVTAFGLQVWDLTAHDSRHPEHDHRADGAEEIYTVLSGSATLVAANERHQLSPGVFVSVGPGETRQLITEDTGARILAIGAVPGVAYQPPPFTELEEA
jgi:quercetin dioxygenase-like cupin family protein